MGFNSAFKGLKRLQCKAARSEALTVVFIKTQFLRNVRNYSPQRHNVTSQEA